MTTFFRVHHPTLDAGVQRLAEFYRSFDWVRRCCYPELTERLINPLGLPSVQPAPEPDNQPSLSLFPLPRSRFSFDDRSADYGRDGIKRRPGY